MNKRSESRVTTKMIPVRATPEQLKEIDARAASCVMSRSSYMLQRGLGFTPSSKTDKEAILELASLRADLGRLGGLLKGWLAGSFEQQPPDIRTRDHVVKLLRQIEDMQQRVIDTVKKIAGH